MGAHVALLNRRYSPPRNGRRRWIVRTPMPSLAAARAVLLVLPPSDSSTASMMRS